MAQTKTATIFYGLGDTLEEAIEVAHRQIPLRHGKDFAISRIVDFGMETGGFVNARKFYARVVEDEHSPFMT